eukprot:5007883-Pleurochrysis_carterae.AAC.1
MFGGGGHLQPSGQSESLAGDGGMSWLGGGQATHSSSTPAVSETQPFGAPDFFSMGSDDGAFAFTAEKASDFT